MGREIRRVPADWQHPTRRDEYIPMYDESYRDALDEWIAADKLWKQGEHPYQNADYEHYAQYDKNPPRVENYRPTWDAAEATWYQVYETVSEGTPVSPPFATQEELIEYLVKNGDFWDQQRGQGGWSRKTAENFIKDGSAPSFISFGGQIMTGVEACGKKDL